MAQYEDIQIDQGTDVAVEIRLINPNQTKKNLAGYTAAAQMRRGVNSSDSDAITFTSIIAEPAVDGIVLLTLNNIQTMAIAPGRYYYDVEISFRDSSNQTYIERVLYGNIDVVPNITRV